MKNFIKILLQRLDSIFREDETEVWSSQRIMSVGIVFIPLITWCVLSFYNWQMQVIPESVLVLIIAGLTGKIASKIIERNGEDKEKSGS